MERKSDKVRRLVAGGSFKEALSIAKGFRMGITKAEADAMTLAYECMVHDRFYKSLGYDLDKKIAEGIAVLNRLYGNECQSLMFGGISVNKKIQNAAQDAELAEKAATELSAALQISRTDPKTVTQSKALVRKIHDLREDIRLLEMDSAIVDVIRASYEAREGRSTLKK